MSLAHTGCDPQRPPLADGPAQPSEPPDFSALIESHNRRVEKLERFYADGIITLRWKDEKGRHEEQADFELWINRPRHTALRVHKLGEEFLYAVSNDRGSGLLDLRRDDDRAAYLARPEGSLAVDASSPIDLDPSALVDLLGLAPLPRDATLFEVKNGSNPTQWLAIVTRGDERTRAHFEQKAFLPISVELLLPTGEVTLRSALAAESYQSVELDNVAPGEYPKLPRRIRIDGPAVDDDEISITIAYASGRAADQSDRVFDIDLLIQRFEPHRVEGKLADPIPSPP